MNYQSDHSVRFRVIRVQVSGYSGSDFGSTGFRVFRVSGLSGLGSFGSRVFRVSGHSGSGRVGFRVVDLSTFSGRVGSGFGWVGSSFRVGSAFATSNPGDEVTWQWAHYHVGR